ncbi:hypothetical protein [Brachybacterium fresconis]|uniref:Nucleic acid-binding protein n=1 Tax=Brachybacterium fresconis TaxID=173363 RepID=A0ABS4YMA0_9MICO|nr:hypothetical protein [Brachybacterium fresconis]MBP2409018.1 hypothetical protein [Brachybacterium fresconis]
MDTSTFTHFWRAGHSHVLNELAPDGIILIPSEVNVEIEQGRALHPEIPPVRKVDWAELVVCDDDEQLTMLGVKADMGGSPTEHLGECAVIACAFGRGGIAILDERKAIEQAGLRDVSTHDSMWIVVHAYALLFDRDRDRAATVIDDLLATGMKLPIASGTSFMQWAYENGLLP